MLLPVRKTHSTGLRLVLMLLCASIMIVVLRKDQDEVGTKREQTLQIDVAFIIHGSKNITSPERTKSLKEALGWAKKVIEAFGEVGPNKTRVGLIVYAEEAKLMFNFTEKVDKGAVLEALNEKAGSPPALGNKTFTGKALKLALKTLVKETRKEAMKKFFVFADRPPDDDPKSAAEAMAAKDVEVYGLGGDKEKPKDYYIHDYGLDSLYMMLKDGPFKSTKENIADKSYQDAMANQSAPTPLIFGTIHNDVIQTSREKTTTTEYPARKPSITGNLTQNGSSGNITSSSLTSQTKVSNQSGLSNQTQNTMSNLGNSISNSGNPVSNSGNPVSSNSGNIVSSQGNPVSNPGNLVSNAGNPGVPQPLITYNLTSLKPEPQISGVISKEIKPKEENSTKIVYGKDASVVITENNMKSRNSVGRYSSTIDDSHSETEFGTVIGGVRVNGQSKFDVIKPKNQTDSESSNLRSKLGKKIATYHRRRHKWRNHRKHSRTLSAHVLS